MSLCLTRVFSSVIVWARSLKIQFIHDAARKASECTRTSSVSCTATRSIRDGDLMPLNNGFGQAKPGENIPPDSDTCMGGTMLGEYAHGNIFNVVRL